MFLVGPLVGSARWLLPTLRAAAAVTPAQEAAPSVVPATYARQLPLAAAVVQLAAPPDLAPTGRLLREHGLAPHVRR